MNAIEHLNGHAHFGLFGELVTAIQSKYQKIEVWDTTQFGRVLMIDDVFMTSMGEEFIYHECMVHPAVSMVNLNNALVVGGGDGGIARELLRHGAKITIAELDYEVVRTSMNYLPDLHRGALTDDNVAIVIGDGLATARTLSNQDLVILDLTDPGTTADSLYSEDSLKIFKSCLGDQGIMVMHLGSPVFHKKQVFDLYQVLTRTFKNAKIMGAYLPIYGSYWLMALASDTNPLERTKPILFDNKYLDPAGYINLMNVPKWFNPQSNGFW